jgi:glycosyltransferase involved in cell wall biosynthesis
MFPEISVIITSFNRAQFIEAAIQSVLNSTFDNFELIISDDMSSDNSYEIACKIAQKDRRIRVYRNETNLGDYPNRILSITRSKGKWIKFVDCDDFISKDCLKVMYDFANVTKLFFGICSPNSLDCKILSTNDAIKSGCLNYYGPSGSFFLKEKYLELGGFVNRITVSDWHMWHRFAMEDNIMIFPTYLATWRDHENNTLKSSSHNFGVIKYYLLSKFEILSNNKYPFNSQQKIALFRKDIIDNMKFSVKFALNIKSIKPIISFFRYNTKYLFVYKIS